MPFFYIVFIFTPQNYPHDYSPKIIYTAQTLTGNVSYVSDGDTIHLIVGNQKYKIRIYGILGEVRKIKLLPPAAHQRT